MEKEKMSKVEEILYNLNSLIGSLEEEVNILEISVKNVLTPEEEKRKECYEKEEDDSELVKIIRTYTGRLVDIKQSIRSISDRVQL